MRRDSTSEEPGMVSGGEAGSWLGMATPEAALRCEVGGDQLRLVFVNGGRGSREYLANIATVADQLLVAELDGVRLDLDGERPSDGPLLATVIAAEEGTVLLEVQGPLPAPVKVSYSGRNSSFKGTNPRDSWLATDLLITDERIAQALKGSLYQVIRPGDSPPGHWLLEEGSLDDFVRAREAKRAAEAEQKRQRAAAKQAEQRVELRETHFVNPYTFVALPGEVAARGEPPGHGRCADDRPLVQIELTWQALTPLATQRKAVFDAGDGRSGLAGSAVKGAVRSLHETLTGSCLRVANLDARVTHRELMQAGKGRTLVRLDNVGKPDENGVRTLSFQEAVEVVWVPSDELSGPVESGKPHDLSYLQGKYDWEKTLARQQFEADPRGDSAFNADDTWIPLVSQAGARQQFGWSGGRRKKKRYHVAFGRFIIDGLCLTLRTTDPVWRTYLANAETSDDVRRRRHASADQQESSQQQVEPAELTVTWHGKEVGVRQEVRHALEGPDRMMRGHLLWANVTRKTNAEDNKIEHLSAAYVWRRLVDHTVRKRLPDKALAPCDDPENLCPSCQVFGAAGDDGARGAKGGHGYRGHLRFEPMLTSKSATSESLAPLSSPRITAGQMYLKQKDDRPHAPEGETPLREWGSVADSKGLRHMRGRKHYWPADPAAQEGSRKFSAERWKLSQAPYQQAARDDAPIATVWGANTEFKQRITVVGLDHAQLGGVLAALYPRLLADVDGLDWSRSVVRMGLGKPFGLGAMRVTNMTIVAHRPSDRYGSHPSAPREIPTDELAKWIEAFVSTVEDRDPWRDLAAVLDPEWVWPEFVTYPVDRWDDYRAEERNSEPNKEYKFEFWKRSVGDHKYPLLPLPLARERDQLMPLSPPPVEGEKKK